MSGSERIPLAEAEALAARVVMMILGVTERCVVAGSIRRRKPDIGDIEIVSIPKVERFLAAEVNHYVRFVTEQNVKGVFRDRLDKNGRKSFGEKFQRVSFEGFALDLFSTTTDDWGRILAIRTGPADYSHHYLAHAWSVRGYEGTPKGLTKNGKVIPVREERDLYDLLKLPWEEPEARTWPKP